MYLSEAEKINSSTGYSMEPEIFSRILHPVLVAPVTGLLYLHFTGISVVETVYWIGIWMMTSMVPTIAYV